LKAIVKRIALTRIRYTILASVTDPGVDCKGQPGDSCHSFCVLLECAIISHMPINKDTCSPGLQGGGERTSSGEGWWGKGISTFVADLGRRGEEGCVAATVCGIHVNDTDTQSIVHCAASPVLATTDW